MTTKQDIIDYLDENFDYFIEKISKYKGQIIDSEIDFSVKLIALTTEEYNDLFSFPVVSFQYYQSYQCGCEYDCCGHLSSISLTVINNKNGYISLFIRISFNY